MSNTDITVPLLLVDWVDDVAVNTFTGRQIDILIFNRPLSDADLAEFIGTIRGDARITRVQEFANELFIENGTPQDWKAPCSAQPFGRYCEADDPDCNYAAAAAQESNSVWAQTGGRS